MRRLLIAAVLVTLAACTDGATQPRSSALPVPSGLTYQLVPSGFPDSPDGVLLSWNDVSDPRLTVSDWISTPVRRPFVNWGSEDDELMFENPDFGRHSMNGFTLRSAGREAGA